MLIQICTYTEDTGLCLGLLLTYSNGSKECLGQIRFDNYISPEMRPEKCVFSNQMVEGKLYVEFRSLSSDIGQCLDEEFRLPTKGEVVWWCGPRGSQMKILEQSKTNI